MTESILRSNIDQKMKELHEYERKRDFNEDAMKISGSNYAKKMLEFLDLQKMHSASILATEKIIKELQNLIAEFTGKKPIKCSENKCENPAKPDSFFCEKGTNHTS